MEVTFEEFIESHYEAMRVDLTTWPSYKDGFAYYGDLDRAIWGFAYSHNRDSDLLQESNWTAINKELTRRNSRSIEIMYCRHDLCGWVEYLMINTNHKKAMYRLFCLLKQLEDYPVLDEEDWGNREYEQAMEVYDNWAKSKVGWLCENNCIIALLNDDCEYDPTPEQEEMVKSIVCDCVLDYNPGEGVFQDTTLIERLQKEFPDPEPGDLPPFVEDTDTLTLDLDWAC
jgi:hypothetical protein